MRRPTTGSRKPNCACRIDSRKPFLRTLIFLVLGYGLMSLLAYCLYAQDKNAARRHRQRVPERLLHLMALLGGWPGALFAQQRLRHKTRKPAFLIVFWLTVMLHLAGLLLVYSMLAR